MRGFLLMLAFTFGLSFAEASKGARFWECFGMAMDGGLRCVTECPRCKRETGANVNCDSVCRMPTVQAGTYAGVRIQ